MSLAGIVPDIVEPDSERLFRQQELVEATTPTYFQWTDRVRRGLRDDVHDAEQRVARIRKRGNAERLDWARRDLETARECLHDFEALWIYKETQS